MYKEKLIELLKTCDEVKEAMEKLEFGTLMTTKTGIMRKFIGFERLNGFGIRFNLNKFYGVDNDGGIKLVNKSQYTIIGLSLQERFIRMYCEFQGKDFNFSTHGGNTLMLLGDKDIPPFLDNTKDFDNQDDIVYQKLYEALYNLNK